LIQNAEDNQYTRATAAGTDPCISFTLYPESIVIDSNEDGFTEENVRAICSTGESTKTLSHGYIGEKGIGFKSVFKVACKVHIQSGPFSFSFEHSRDADDDGLGMVTPVNEEHGEVPKDVGTRMTLKLLDTSAFQHRVRDFLELPDTLLLFLTKIKTIAVNIHFPDGKKIGAKHSYEYDFVHRLGKLTKKTESEHGSNETASLFHLTRRQLDSLPSDNARKHTNQAEVVLAFPLDEDHDPIIDQQHVFAFLPLRNVGFTVGHALP
jgi:hypothetical protein